MSDQLLANLCPAFDAVVVGATGAIGGAIVEILLRESSAARVTACARHARSVPALLALAQTHAPRLELCDLDLCDQASIDALADQVGGRALHLVVNAAGLLHADALAPEKSLAAVRLAHLQQVFAVNAFGPVLLAQALLPFMRHDAPSVFASLSARVGSIGDNRLGGWYAYRAAKAAQNQLLKTAAIEARRTHPQLCVQILHPGTVDSALSQPFQRGVAAEKLFLPQRAARQLLAVVSSAKAEHSGRFLAWDGSEIAW